MALRGGFYLTRAGTVSCALAVLLGSVSVHTTAQAGDDSLWTRDTFTGDWGGARTSLSNAGIDWSLTYTGEVFGNLSGGIETGAAYEDLISLEVDTDLEKLVGWKGGTAHVSLYQIDDGGRNAADLVGSISDPSNIDARPTFRLFTLYVQQSLGNAGSLRVGQLAADDEFLISDTAANLINGTYGWANIAAANLPAGGPAYPLAAPGLRLELDPSDKVKMLGAVFSGNPAGDCPPDEDPQACDDHGTTFSFTGGALFMGEVQYRPNAKPNGDDDGGPPESVYRLGGWYHNDEFPDQALGRAPDGSVVSLAVDPSDPIEHDGNWGLYGIVDQTVWHNGSSSLALFLRVAGAPADRNELSFYIDGGFGITGPFASRPDDVLAFGAAYSQISSDAAALDKATRRITGTNYPIRDGETSLELTYIAQVAPWWTLQPDLQYIIHPGGNVPDPDDPSHVIEDSFLIGLRTTVAF